MGWFSFQASEVLWWALIGLICIVAVVAIIFAGLAFGESQVYKPYRNLVRHDLVLMGDAMINGDTKVEEMDAEVMRVHKGGTISRLRVSSLRLNDVVIISETGPAATIHLTPANSAYRIDSPPGTQIDLFLPPAAEASGQLFQITKSQTGAEAIVKLHIATGDFLCTNIGCQPASLDPTISLLSNQADQLWITNDSLSSWKSFSSQ